MRQRLAKILTAGNIFPSMARSSTTAAQRADIWLIGGIATGGVGFDTCSDERRSGHFILLETSTKVVDSLFPMDEAPAMIAKAIRDARMLYSIAVAPDSFAKIAFKNALKR
jgi:hypothetical protein